MASQTWNYTGSWQSWTVPAGVTSITIDMAGSAGAGSQPGAGARVQATVTVTPGAVLQIFAGGNLSGFDGGNASGTGRVGGDSSRIQTSATIATATAIAIAAGGGGSGSFGGGGAGGAPNGSAGSGGAPGQGGTTSGGGSAGSMSGTVTSNPTPGSSGQGGNGGTTSTGGAGGGGGGGLFGGGGGGCQTSSGYGGGGGSSLIPSGGSGTAGYNTGGGYVTITYTVVVDAGTITLPATASLTVGGVVTRVGAVAQAAAASLSVGGQATAYGSVGRASEDFSGGMPADIYAAGSVTVVSDYGNPGNSIKGGVGDWWWFTSARFPVSGDFDYYTDVILNPDGGTGDDRALLGFWSDGNGGTANGFKYRLGSHTDGNNGFSRVTNGAGEATIGTAVADVAAATWYRVHLSGRGNSVTADVTRISDGALIASTTVDLTSSLNSTHPARGTFGQFNGGGTTTSGHRWDNIVLTQAGMQATASMTIGGAVTDVAAVAMTVATTLSVAAKATQFAAVSMAAVAALSTSGSATTFALATMSAAAALSVAGTRVLVGAVTMAASASLTATPGPVTNVAAVTLTAASSLTVPSSVTVLAAVTLVGVGTITVPAFATTTGVVSMAAVAALVTSGIPVAFGKYPPDGILLQTNLTGALATVQDDPDAPDGTWMTGTGGAVTLRLSFPSPPNTLFAGAGQQRFRVLVRYGP